MDDGELASSGDGGKVNSGSLGRLRERRDWRGWGAVEEVVVEEGGGGGLEIVGDGAEAMVGWGWGRMGWTGPSPGPSSYCMYVYTRCRTDVAELLWRWDLESCEV